MVLKSVLHEDPRSKISATCPKVTHGHQKDMQTVQVVNTHTMNSYIVKDEIQLPSINIKTGQRSQSTHSVHSRRSSRRDQPTKDHCQCLPEADWAVVERVLGSPSTWEGVVMVECRVWPGGRRDDSSARFLSCPLFSQAKKIRWEIAQTLSVQWHIFVCECNEQIQTVDQVNGMSIQPSLFF